MNAVAVIDDWAARTAAKIIGIRVKVTLGVVLYARKENRIASAVSILKQLKDVGLHLSDSVIRDALAKTTGEVWPE